MGTYIGLWSYGRYVYLLRMYLVKVSFAIIEVQVDPVLATGVVGPT